MRVRDVGGGAGSGEASFTTPWSRSAFVSELLNNERAYYFVARNIARRGPLPWNTGQIMGYIGMWLIYDEGHITNVAVHPDYRQQGIGRRLMEAMTAVCVAKGATRMTLEVRAVQHRRPATISGPGLRQRRRSSGLLSGQQRRRTDHVEGTVSVVVGRNCFRWSRCRDLPLILGIETSCDETAAAVVERGRHIHSNVVASQIAAASKSSAVSCRK